MEIVTKTKSKTHVITGLIALAALGIALGLVLPPGTNPKPKPTTCAAPPQCSAGKVLAVTGNSGGCNLYTCKSQCPAPPKCGVNTVLKTTGMSAGCTQYTCKQCPSKPTCGPNTWLNTSGYDSDGCTKYTCVPGSVQQGN